MLSIVKRMIELMGGNIGVASQLGAGCLLSFTLILEQGSIRPQAQAEGPAEKTGRDPDGLRAMFTHHKVRIRLADDNVSNQQVALSILKKLSRRRHDCKRHAQRPGDVSPR